MVDLVVGVWVCWCVATPTVVQGCERKFDVSSYIAKINAIVPAPVHK